MQMYAKRPSNISKLMKLLVCCTVGRSLALLEVRLHDPDLLSDAEEEPGTSGWNEDPEDQIQLRLLDREHPESITVLERVKTMTL